MAGRVRHGTKANDIVHWQTTIVTDDVTALARKLRQERVDFVSSDVVVLPRDKTGFAKGVMVSDPDGHNVLLIEK